MSLDPRTLLTVTVALYVPISVMLLLTWQTDRRERTLLHWACTFFVFAIGGVLYLLRDDIPKFISIDIANALLLTGAGTGVAAARVFNGRTTSPLIIFFGASVWLLSRQFPLFQGSQIARTAIFASLAALYVLAIGMEYWRGRADRLLARYIVVVTCLMLVGYYVVRLIASALGFVSPKDSIDGPNIWMALSVLAPTVATVVNAILVVGMVKERAEKEQRRIAEIDSLTGVLNRGAIFKRIEDALKPGGRAIVGGAVLVFDLDHFKLINARFGHPAGDLALREFSAVALKHLRQSDFFGRIGGEEFLALLPGCDTVQSMAAAERIRAAFAAIRIEKDGVRIPATVSIGVANCSEGADDIDPLLIEADRALYSAKKNGRDPVQFHVPEAA